MPISHRGNACKVEFLRNAVVGCEWATEPLSRIATYNLTFQQLYGELESGHLLNKEAKIAVLRENIASNRKADGSDESNLAGIHFTDKEGTGLEKTGEAGKLVHGKAPTKSIHYQ